ncbi:MAG: Endonuclease [Pedosphaera sp.]|nr:Endonuclease [Pedosphaera sp.]
MRNCLLPSFDLVGSVIARWLGRLSFGEDGVWVGMEVRGKQALRRARARGGSETESETSKVRFDIDIVMARVREAVQPYPKAALFELAEEGFSSVFEQLVACIISIRTLDEVTVTTARRLFEIARTPAEVIKLEVAEIDRLIRDCTFHEPKARTIRDIAITAAEQHDGVLPCDVEVLLGLRGVGPKCANLALGIACGQARIAVDIHVHRVTNRWGCVQTPTPEQTMVALESVLPKRYWVEINRLLVPFGKHICTGKLPHCSTCPVLEMCRQVGVQRHS